LGLFKFEDIFVERDLAFEISRHDKGVLFEFITDFVKFDFCVLLLLGKPGVSKHLL